jgi:hypothetical protein
MTDFLGMLRQRWAVANRLLSAVERGSYKLAAAVNSIDRTRFGGVANNKRKAGHAFRFSL